MRSKSPLYQTNCVEKFKFLFDQFLSLLAFSMIPSHKMT
uniref:Uncharacterized protein n=1 Tax=Manihot esculenta TaxID=3983 RepID=A0A2C9WLC9_MANES